MPKIMMKTTKTPNHTLAILPALVVSTLSIGLLPAFASAYTANVERAVAQDATSLKAVIANGTQMRCGDQDVFYAVAEFNAGSMVTTVGVSGNYTKVLLLEAFVPVNEVDLTPQTGVVVLATDSKLRAPSRLMGLSGSWKGVYNTALKAGTSLHVTETLLSDSGEIVGYRVVPPLGEGGETAVAYIRTDALRDLTAQEIEANNAGHDSGTPAQTNRPKPVVPTPDPQPETTPDTTQAPEDDTPTNNSLMEEMDVPSEAKPDQSKAEPVEIENSTPKEATPETPTDPGHVSAPKGLVSASALEDLEAAFDSARKLTKAQLDATLDELAAEFSRTRAQAQEGTSLATALDQRLEWIAIRIESRDQRRSIDAILAAYDARVDQAAKDIQAWQDGRAYQLVGRMVTSSIYTGEHLPLLYRIQAIDPATGDARTIGYVAPSPDQDFRHLLGRVVGVIGALNNDASLKLSVIAPDRIEPMPE